MTDFIDSTGGEVKVKLNPDGSIPTGPAGSGGGSSGAEPVNLKQVGGAAIALGRTTAAASLPVTLASDQPTLPTNLAAVGGGAISLGQASRALSIPVAIASDQTDVPSNIDKIGGSPITIGQSTMAGSLPIAIASDQSTVPTRVVPQTALVGAFTASNAGNTSQAAPANTNLRKLRISFTGNASMAAAGNEVVTIQLNGNNVAVATVYLPNAAPGAPPAEAWSETLDFDTISFPSGSSGQLTINLATALTSGVCVAQAWYA